MKFNKLIKKLKFAQFVDHLEEPIQEPIQPIQEPTQPISPTQETGFSTVPQLPTMEGNNSIQTKLTEWSPSRGYNKSTKYYYLQLIMPPTFNNEEFGEDLIAKGYKFNKKFGMFSKQVKPENALSIEGELKELETTFNVMIEKTAITEMQEIFGFDANTNINSTNEDDEIKNLKFMGGDDKEKYRIAKEIIVKRLENFAQDLDSQETKDFLKQFLNVNNKFYRYSPVNTLLITWQNSFTDPTTGKTVPRSGTVSSSGAWEEKFGRKVKEGEVGMDIFVPIGGGTKEVKPAAMNSLISPMSKFKAINKGGDLSNDDNIRKFFGFMKNQIAFSKKDWGKGKIFKSNFDYLVRLYNDHKEEFKSVDSIIQYLSNKASSGEKETTFAPLRFTMKPVYDMDQTEVIPGQEDKDPKAEMDRVEAMWLGENNEPDEKCSSLAAMAIKAAESGQIVKDKRVDIALEQETGGAGGWSSGGNISIRKGSMGQRQLFTIFHELAHEILHWGKERVGSSKKEREVEAEATAAIVMEHYGFTEMGHASKYIGFYTKDKDFVINRFQPILEASNAIVAGIETQKVANFGNEKIAGTSWYSRKKFAGELKATLLKKILSFKESDILKEAHYEEGEEKGEGYGGPKQFGKRRLDDWINDHNEEVLILRNTIKNNYKGFDEFYQKLLNKYENNKKIVDGILGAAMSGQKI
jgi:hypothetical protein